MSNNDNLYKSLYDDDDETIDTDVGLNILNDIYNHLDYEEMSKYFTIQQYNDTLPVNLDNTLSIMHMNTRSFFHKRDYINIFFASLKKIPDIFCVSESWLTDTNSNVAKLDGFNSYHIVRPAGHEHGGVSCFVNNLFESELLEQFSFVNEYLEICSIKVKIREESYIISTIYRPSSKHIDVDIFEKRLCTLLKNNIFKKNKHILLGDFNINLLEFCTHSPTNQFITSIQTHKYIPLIARPTRFPDLNQKGYSSLLDHIYVNFAPPSVSGIFEHILSDHRPIFLNISLPHGIECQYQTKFRLINSQNRELFKRALCDVHWEFLLIQNDLNSNFDIFFDKFSELYNKHFPIMTKTVNKKRIIHPWITPSLLNAIRNKNFLYKSLKRGYITENYYKNYCSHLNKVVKRTKSNYLIKVFSDFRNNIKKTWETLNKLMGKEHHKTKINNIIYENKILDSATDISEAFNRFFSNVASDLESKLPPSQINPMQFMKGNFPESIEAPVANLDIVFKVIKSLPNKSASLHDFSPIVVKENIHLLAHPLCLLFNQSINTGKFPQSLKLARITPLYKKGPKHDINNYRPISQLNIFSKIFEKIMKYFLVDFLEKKQIIHPAQFGFQKGKSTLHALIRFSSMLYENLNKGKSILSIFIDFSKAFDTVPHNILLQKLSHYGIRGKTLQWLEDYLKNRHQITIIENQDSTKSLVSTGVPQGSVLGPLLFLIFIKDLPSISDSIFFSLFADDSCLSLTDYDIIKLISLANRELFVFYDWCIANRLSINTIKTFYLVFTNKPDISAPPLLIRNNFTYDIIKRVSHTKFLGVIYDDKLNFSHHITMLSNKLSRTSSLIYQLCDHLPIHVLKKI